MCVVVRHHVQSTVYSCPTNQRGATGSLFAARPSLNISTVSHALCIHCWANNECPVGKSLPVCVYVCLCQVSGDDVVVPYYDPALLVSGWGSLLNASLCYPHLKSQETYLFDLVAITVQVLPSPATRVHVCVIMCVCVCARVRACVCYRVCVCRLPRIGHSPSTPWPHKPTYRVTSHHLLQCGRISWE